MSQRSQREGSSLQETWSKNTRRKTLDSQQKTISFHGKRKFFSIDYSIMMQSHAHLFIKCLSNGHVQCASMGLATNIAHRNYLEFRPILSSYLCIIWLLIIDLYHKHCRKVDCYWPGKVGMQCNVKCKNWDWYVAPLIVFLSHTRQISGCKS